MFLKKKKKKKKLFSLQCLRKETKKKKAPVTAQSIKNDLRYFSLFISWRYLRKKRRKIKSVPMVLHKTAYVIAAIKHHMGSLMIET